MIHNEVYVSHLNQFPEELSFIKKFELDFDIKWGKRVLKFNANASIYFLEPKKHIKESFGMEQEVVLVYSEYHQIQARLIQLIEHFFSDVPAKGRVDQTIAIILSKDKDPQGWTERYLAKNPLDRSYISISIDDIEENFDDWFIRNKFAYNLYARDLFDYTLPIDGDLFFFGRQKILSSHIDAIRKFENRGLFGLRKTGKTSILFKIMRQCEKEEIKTLYYDCKSPHIYMMTATNFLDKISDDIEEKLGIKSSRKKYASSYERFSKLFSNKSIKNTVCLIFDEIEYISFVSKADNSLHWHKDFIPFWQTIWSAQSQLRKFSFLLGGVNASITEVEKINGVQNPLFGIVKSQYLTGLEQSEIFSMLGVFGKRMGIRFSENAVNSLYSRYGGHPLLTRVICSHTNSIISASETNRPIDLTEELLNELRAPTEEEIQFYCGHITSEMEDFYPLEYEMLEFIATKDFISFSEFSDDEECVRHLKKYGLINISNSMKPTFLIPVLEKYIHKKWKKKNNIKTDFYVVNDDRRKAFVFSRIKSIIGYLRTAEKKFKKLSLERIYNGHGPAEADKLIEVNVVSDRDSFENFINQMYKSLVEYVDTCNRSSAKSHFKEKFRNEFPELFHSFNRIKIYRDKFHHLSIRDSNEELYKEYLKEDLSGKEMDNMNDGWFILQQVVLDATLISIHLEIAKYD